MIPRAFVCLLPILAVISATARADDAAEPAPWRLAAHAETAGGVAPGRFRNGLVGARLDWLASPRVSLGAYLGIASLKGREGRVHVPLPYVQLEHRTPLAQDGRWTLPVRFGTGYLPRNGPIARAAAGLGYAVRPDVDLVVELFAPTVWSTHDQTLLSFSLALELGWRL